MTTARKPAYRTGRRISLSLATAIALWALLAVGVISSPPGNILSWDTFGYHLYLPATFIHHDPAIHDPAWVNEVVDQYKSTGTLYQVSALPNGTWVNKYPMGLALLWSPFFVVAHVIAGITGAPQDGFSAPYQWALIIAALSYMLVGFLLLRKVLRTFFSEGITAIVLALIVTGTNYLHQAISGTGMPHIFLFTLGAGVLWQSIQWHRTHQRRHAVLLGLLLGLLTVSRPSEIVWAVVPLLIGLQQIREWRAHLRMLWQWRSHLLLAAAVAVVVCMPQLLYWKMLAGKWLYNSYNNAGEGFEFLHPYTWEVLFSFRKGWFIYAPLMLVATLGLMALRERVPQLRWAVIAFFVLNLYLVSSWSCWWYADSFGQRALVQSYALMALPLGALLMWLRESRSHLRFVGAMILFGLVGLNLFQTRQCETGLIHTSRMTWLAYKAVFGTMDPPENFSSLLSVERSYNGENSGPDLTKYNRIPMATLSFDEEPSDTVASSAFRGAGSFRLGPGREFTPAWSSPWEEITARDHAWIEVSCRVQRPTDGSTPHLSLVTTFEHKGESYAYKAVDVQYGEIAPGEWVKASTWYLSPEVRRPHDVLKVYCWLQDTLPVRVDEMEINIYEPLMVP